VQLQEEVKMIKADYYKMLKDTGCKLTEQRKVILESLIENPGHHTAEEIFEMVKSKYNKINFSTIYRNLELMTNLKIIDKLSIKDGISHYELNILNHHHHIICTKCGEMTQIDMCPYVEQHVAEEIKKMNFKPTNHKFEIYGYCHKCSKE
jgi:Fe2+ or Zn2+ uptake regulation protein